ncbi:hypothetical protein VTK73DRAFT_5226 [Phialemonium thermophilum]|uniref:Uncharacterized protein n=1 Tax=Phialemonium thermophilum TaxID=223376 RepID=A0ABR3V360_9PEZI
MRPPVTLPVVTMPRARPRRRSKKVEVVDSMGQHRKPAPEPKATPWASMSCQYWVQKEVPKVPMVCSAVPMAMAVRKEPIQEIWEGGRPKKSE